MTTEEVSGMFLNEKLTPEYEEEESFSVDAGRLNTCMEDVPLPTNSMIFSCPLLMVKEYVPSNLVRTKLV